ncbi:LecA/PA-IL family lectin [Pseudocitrobacter cyperus]|uniref:LecA/PA-IL family lectin n=1 Tax=Pseudocitrobacter cyperus TaxID=3112843 RepID=A0ABV0HHM7_9ENTR
MSEQKIWSGKVPANIATGVDTGISVSTGDVLTIRATGCINYGAEAHKLGFPDGRVKEGMVFDSTKVLKARFADSGKSYDIGSSVINWPVPEKGTLQLYVADTPNGYSDNKGNFDAEVYK